MGIDVSKVPRWMCKSYFNPKPDDDDIVIESLETAPETNWMHKTDDRLPLNSPQVYNLKASWKRLSQGLKSLSGRQ